MRRFALPCAGAAAAGLLAIGGCPDWNPGGGNARYVNATDPTNGGASYVGGSACRQCHADIATASAVTGHASALTAIRGGAPVFPAGAAAAGVPMPPAGFEWSDISYVIGGYSKGALFLDADGFVLTTGATGTNTLWQAEYPANGSAAEFVSFEAASTARRPYAFDEFARRTVGAAPLDPSNPQYQENRQGIQGTWHEAGVQCESCHGPGGGHFATVDAEVQIDRARIFVDPSGSESCGRCHDRTNGDGSGRILAAAGFIRDQQQWTELKASGGHSKFACTVCHDPHRSVQSDRTEAIRNECRTCHPVATMAGHRGKTIQLGSYNESVTCLSCHMSFATSSVSRSTPDFAGSKANVGDTRTHIFRIDVTQSATPTMFTPDGSEVLRDEKGRAAVTVNFICLRCHNEFGAFELTPARAAEIAGNIHQLP